jgi:hypothetical protein
VMSTVFFVINRPLKSYTMNVNLVVANEIVIE